MQRSKDGFLFGWTLGCNTLGNAPGISSDNAMAKYSQDFGAFAQMNRVQPQIAVSAVNKPRIRVRAGSRRLSEVPALKPHWDVT